MREYEILVETTNKEEKRKYWDIAFGLQEVDNLKPSEYMKQLATDNVNGKYSYKEVEKNINDYYSSQKFSINLDEQEADLVSLRIVELLNDSTFSFNYLTLKQIHKYLFTGLDVGIESKYIGEFRDYNISKEESILENKSVMYADYTMIKESLIYDFNEELEQQYLSMDDNEKAERLARFTSNIWQVHPFGEGNTRTTAVFIQKYLISKGFAMDNELFKENSKYFRNALVRANYSNIQEGVEEDLTYLIKFFENLLLNKNNELNNEDLFINNKLEDMEI